jgi:hypothetical protein
LIILKKLLIWALFTALMLLEVELFSQPADTLSRELPPIEVLGSSESKLNIHAFSSQWVADSLSRFWGGSEESAILLAQMPGIYLFNYGGHGGVRSISQRGLASNTSQVLLDGVWVPELQSGIFDFSGWLLDGLESLEVSSTGPEMAGGSSGTWINLKSGRPRTWVSLGGGSFGQRNAGAAHRIHKGALSLGIHYKYLTASDRFPYEWNEVRGIRQNADYHLHQFGMVTRQSIRNNQLLTYRLVRFDRQQGVPGPVVKGNPGSPNERMHQQHVFHYLKWEGCNLDFSWALSVSNRINRLQLFSGREPDRYDLMSTGIQAEVHRSYQTWDFKIGLRANQAELFGNNLGINFRPLDRVSRSELHVGAGVSWHSTIDSSLKESRRKISLHVGQGIVEGFKPESQITFQAQQLIITRANLYGFVEGIRGIRYPSFNELYYFAFGNSGLEVERVWSVQGGFRWLADPNGWVTVRLAAFSNWTENKIVSIPITPARWTTFSLGRTQALGIELAASATPISWMRGFANLSWMQTQDFSLTNGAELPYFPRLLFQGGCELTVKRCWASFSLNYTGSRFSSLMNDRFYRLDPYVLLKISIGTRMKTCEGDWLSIESAIENVLAAQYVVIQSFPMPGRSFWFRLSWFPATNT